MIIIMGLKNSGKSTSSMYLSKKYGFEEVAFANRLKQITSVIFDLDVDLLEGITTESRNWREEPNHNVMMLSNNKISTPREALVFVAEEIIKPVLGKGFFAKVIADRIDSNVVVTDLRFISEYEICKEYATRVILVRGADEPDYVNNIIGSSYDSAKRYMDTYHPNVSNGEWEIYTIEPTHTVHNTRDKDYLYQQLDKII